MAKELIILGSSRSNGHTRTLIDYLQTQGEYDVIDLLDYKIGEYDYEYENADDDFLPLMQSIITKYDTFIFATPVYWYSMSGIMKTFFDRISDLLRTEKSLGRKLRGKSMGMISCSGHDDRNEHFAEPFELTAGYLGMDWIGDVHGFLEEDGDRISEEVKARLENYSRTIRGIN